MYKRWQRALALFLIVCLCGSIPAGAMGGVFLLPTSAQVEIDGENRQFDAYEIGGNNYFKLRDLAFVLNGSQKQFSVSWVPEEEKVILESGEPYLPVGGEMVARTGTAKEATPSKANVELDGEPLELTAFSIGGNNYFKLRDLMAELDIGVIWDGREHLISVDTSISYEEPDAATELPMTVPALLYHHISEDVTNNMMVTPEKFKADMIALQEAGYTSMLPDELVAAYENNKFPQKPILIMFDDGYESNYQYAFPVLQELEMKATIFAIGWSVGQTTMPDGTTPITPHFTISQGKEMVESGLISIQPHSYDLHWDADLENGKAYGILRLADETPEQYQARFQEDLEKSIQLIEEEMGGTVTSYSYPYGLYEPLADEVLKEHGITTTFAVRDMFSALDWSTGLYHLCRLTVFQETLTEDLIDTIAERTKK